MRRFFNKLRKKPDVAENFAEDIKTVADIGDPWRTIPDLKTQTLRALMNEIEEYKPPSDIPRANILLVGCVGAGKSSFINTVTSIFKGRIAQAAVVGSVVNGDRSLTLDCRRYDVKSQNLSDSLNFSLYDIPGLEGNQGVNILDIDHVVKGNIKSKYKFNPASVITQEHEYFVQKPKLADQMHCVAFVVDATTVEYISVTAVEQIYKILQQLNATGVSRVALLTKIDKLSEDVKDDESKAFKSTKVKEVVDLTAEKFGLPPVFVLPVRNVGNDFILNDPLKCLALLALSQMINYADDFLSKTLLHQ